MVADIGERRLVERRVDDRAFPGALALEQCGGDADRRPHPGPHVDERRADAHAGTSRLAGHADQAARGLHEGVVPRLLAERTDVAVCADGAVDEPRIAGADRVRAEPDALGEAGPEALEEHVGPIREPEHCLAAALVREGDGERALPGVHGQEHRALAVPERRPPGAAVVPRVRPLDLHDVGSERAEDLSAEGPGDRGRHVHDAHVREGEERHRAIIAVRACEDAPVPDWLDFDQMVDWVSGEWWAYPVIFAVAVIDAFFPLVPSETLVIVGGNLASSGDLSLPLVILAGAAGAILGDNISFALGSLVGERTVKRWFRGEKAQQRLLWAERMLDERGAYIIIIARFIPGGRTAVTFSAGYIPTFPWRRFIVYDVAAGVVWATYAALLGYFGGKTFEDHPLLGVGVALAFAIGVGLAIEAVRHFRQRRQTT